MRTITTTEAEWDAEDRAIIYAILDYQADQCPGCGQQMADSLHVEGEPDPTYVSSFAVCVGCMAREKAQTKQDELDESREKSGARVFRSARRWVLSRRS